MRILPALAVALLLAAPDAQAEFWSGNTLLERCRATTPIDRMDCLGYTTAVVDVWTGIENCPPAAATRGQIADIALKYVVENPDQRHLSADVILRGLFSTLWPCQRRQPAPAPGNFRTL